MHYVTISQPSASNGSNGLSRFVIWHVHFPGIPASFVHHALEFAVLFLLGYLFVRTVVYLVICRITQSAIRALPVEKRPISPKLVWLLLIPVVPFVLNYFIYLPLANAYRAYAGDRSDLNVA